MASGYSIKGLDQLNARLQKIAGLGKHKESMVAGGLVGEKYAKENAPVGETSFLKNSITTVKTDDGAEVRVGAGYGIYQEFGTYKMPAHPFLRPAFIDHQDEIVNAIAKDLEKKAK
jgi:HK97 gp10 family phage protein